MDNKLHNSLMTYLHARLYGQPGKYGAGKLKFYAIVSLLLLLLPLCIVAHVFSRLYISNLSIILCAILWLCCWLLATVCLVARSFYIKLYEQCEKQHYVHHTVIVTEVETRGKWAYATCLQPTNLNKKIYKLLDGTIVGGTMCELINVTVGKTNYEILFTPSKESLDYVYQLRTQWFGQWQQL